MSSGFAAMSKVFLIFYCVLLALARTNGYGSKSRFAASIESVIRDENFNADECKRHLKYFHENLLGVNRTFGYDSE